MLSSHVTFSDSQSEPIVVYLHGLLGCGKDWQQVRQQLADFPSITIDLPGHGLSALHSCFNFEDCCNQISDTLLTHVRPEQPIVLVGYSMGGRVAMSGVANHYFSPLNIQRLVVEGGNFGLQTEQDKKARWDNDHCWAERFRNEPIEQVLADWYLQRVFSSLNHEQRQNLILKRSANLGTSVADMLEATSLAKQDYLLERLKSSGVTTHYICGEKDNKFSQLAEQSGLSFSQIAQAGHNVHIEQPQAFAEIIKAQLNSL
ncbi:2-succinyl-6-hydroxy-2,4-cyclohexadiene-1-carboxylate synthase [Vibrio orientalis CIP 102891 = ATCC 33934]|uniref:Putative 2-succinyl-6-hydroxy-2,4-cyclohexadiene-1-carboxylate synthase n=1 Tax=Vibrio orientalis CIP 102891 = ATCC 33934 TaxID=675816 RepID=C9QIL3_VIBOR|nr:2-succinyl-6-hydroxy-2,4-cyclohexadiene-1-carboxylate synthase [Vibrio orientalis]EEX92740.1 2-succinyl-6-hydroxy-2,4-cyclohexadiene-1-carboxylate synthase [Vibrio orientalis CIP 102891 = ATCC 33934]EGU52526.1 2-succinyl-6-hydroxy-2,4-cyclohexadiene-1-carboxylate synthase [Vibrio orientalis CIP 102891 = ATCC 33934]